MSTFHGLPMVEAQAAVYLRATEADGGTQGDPEHCRWANAAKRMYGGMSAFFRTVALIEVTPGTITRFEPKVMVRGRLVTAGRSSEYRKAIDDFDATGEMPDMTIILGPSNPHRTLAKRRKENKKYRQNPRPSRVHNITNTGTANGKVGIARGGFIVRAHQRRP